MAKYRATSVREEKDRNGVKRKIFRVEPITNDKPCKECGREPRQMGSSRGLKCSQAHKRRKLDEQRLREKIQEQKLKDANKKT